MEKKNSDCLCELKEHLTEKEHKGALWSEGNVFVCVFEGNVGGYMICLILYICATLCKTLGT